MINCQALWPKLFLSCLATRVAKPILALHECINALLVVPCAVGTIICLMTITYCQYCSAVAPCKLEWYHLAHGAAAAPSCFICFLLQVLVAWLL
jgi:hypothetical protein